MCNLVTNLGCTFFLNLSLIFHTSCLIFARLFLIIFSIAQQSAACTQVEESAIMEKRIVTPDAQSIKAVIVHRGMTYCETFDMRSVGCRNKVLEEAIIWCDDKEQAIRAKERKELERLLQARKPR